MPRVTVCNFLQLLEITLTPALHFIMMNGHEALD
jgi:hypothetical protein